MNAINSPPLAPTLPAGLTATPPAAPAAPAVPGSPSSASDAAAAKLLVSLMGTPSSGFSAASAQTSAPVSLSPPQANVVIPSRSIYGGVSDTAGPDTAPAVSPAPRGATPIAPAAAAPEAPTTTPVPVQPAPVVPVVSGAVQAADLQSRQSLLGNLTAAELAQLTPDEQANLPSMSLAELQSLFQQKKLAQHSEVVTLMSNLMKMEHDSLMAIIQNIRSQ